MFSLNYLMDIYKPIIDTSFWKYKYSPTKIEDIDINKTQLYHLKKWLDDFDKNKQIYSFNKLKKKKDIADFV